jgi:serine/threonine protein kinase
MELVEGETLAEQIARAPIAQERALEIACQIAEALEAAHDREIIHRDLKPANIKLTPDGNVKVLDFGLAKDIRRPARIRRNRNLPRSWTARSRRDSRHRRLHGS